jgi:glycosyltransferase involved in cell wall biosynthesis
MKVVLAGLYPIDPERINGGVEAVIVYLVEGLLQIEKLDIHIVTCRKQIKEEKIVDRNGITIHFLPTSKMMGNLTLGVEDRSKILKKIKTLNPDIVHAHSQDTYARAALDSGYPVVITAHGIFYKELKFKSGLLNWIRLAPRIYLENICLKDATNLISISPYIEKVFAHMTKAKMFLIENPISSRYFQIKNDTIKNRILFAGSISRLKNLLDLLRAINVLKDQFSDIKLCIAGAIEELEYFKILQSYIKLNKIENNVVFLGHLSEDSLLDEYKRCSLFVLSSVQETAPMVIQQAMAAEKPVVATKVGGIPYIIKDGETGFLVNLGDINELSRKICILLKDDDLRAKMGRKAKEEAILRFKNDIIAVKTYKVYEEVINDSLKKYG